MFILIFWNQYELSIIANRAVALSHVGPAFFSFFFYTIGDAVEATGMPTSSGFVEEYPLVSLPLQPFSPSA